MLVTIRHGKTDYNEKELYSGQTDAPRLTDKALLEALEKGKELVQYNLDIAIVSTLTRAKQTFNELNKTLNIPCYYSKNIIERDFKKYDCKPGEVLNPYEYWDVLKDGSIDIETIKHLEKRILKELKRIKRKYKDKNVLIVAHSGVCRVIKYLLEGKKETNLYNYDMDNLHVEVYKEW